jgi:hypothetical protein
MTSEQIRKEAESLVKGQLDEIFTTIHAKAKTTGGDITPDQTLKLNSLIDEVVNLITEQVTLNLPEQTEDTQSVMRFDPDEPLPTIVSFYRTSVNEETIKIIKRERPAYWDMILNEDLYSESQVDEMMEEQVASKTNPIWTDLYRINSIMSAVGASYFRLVR